MENETGREAEEPMHISMAYVISYRSSAYVSVGSLTKVVRPQQTKSNEPKNYQRISSWSSGWSMGKRKLHLVGEVIREDTIKDINKVDMVVNSSTSSNSRDRVGMHTPLITR